MKKLDNIINALETPAVEAYANDSNRRLESVKKTREVLITDPNSKAHLRIGKLKAVRKRAGLLAATASSADGADSSRSTGGVIIGAGPPGGGFQRVAGKGGAIVSDGSSLTVHAPGAFVGFGGSTGSGGMDGLLEVAASLSDGETPGTPTRDQPDSLRDRSPRISGCIAPGGGSDPNSCRSSFDGVRPTGAGVGGWAMPSQGGGFWDGAAALGALKPGGAFTALVAPRPTRPVPHNAAATATGGILAEHVIPPMQQAPAPPELAPPGRLDPNVYAAAMAAFVRPPGIAPPPTAPAAGSVPAGAPGMPLPPGMPSQISAMGGMNPYMAQMFAWMAAMGGAAQQHQAQQQQQQQHMQPLPGGWNPAGFQQMAAAAAAGLGKLPVSAPPAPAPPAPQPQQIQAVHQPL